MAQSVDPSATSTPNLFPTTTAGRGDSVGGGPGSANVYYLVVSHVLSLSQEEKAKLMIVSRCTSHHSDAGCLSGI